MRIALGVPAVALSARLSVPVPGSDVPQGAQTLAVLLVGAWLGAGDGAMALVAYALVGGLGLPVFSDGASGWMHLGGPTGGYILGFIGGAALAGRCADLGLLRRVAPCLGAMLVGHVVILGSGWSWLAVSVGAGTAYATGVAPFVVGGIAKSIVGAALTVAALSPRARSRAAPSEETVGPF